MAAKGLEETYAALKDQERDLADLDAEITGAETELATWQSQLEQGDVAARVEARRWVSEWESELAALRGKREFADAQMLPLRDAHSKARAALEQATGAMEGRKLNATPALSYYGAGRRPPLTVSGSAWPWRESCATVTTTSTTPRCSSCCTCAGPAVSVPRITPTCCRRTLSRPGSSGIPSTRTRSILSPDFYHWSGIGSVVAL
jgi:hypothetical protein